MIALRSRLLLHAAGPLPQCCLLPEGYRLDAYTEQTVCRCGATLSIAKTVLRHPVGIAFGRPELHVHLCRCPNCRAWYRPALLDELVGAGRVYGYMLIFDIGLARFRDHKQLLEIQRQLRSRHALLLPRTTISELADDFLDLLHAVHNRRADSLRHYFKAVQGGFVMALDGTCELGSEVLFILRDTVSGIVLHAARMPTENERDIRSAVEFTVSGLGTPLATLSDLSPKILKALEVLPGSPVVRRFICHYHFLENVGKALLGDVHVELGRLIRKTKIKSVLHGRRKDMVRESRDKTPVTEANLLSFIESGTVPANVSPGQLRRRLAHFALKWLDDSNADLRGEYFPFDQPSLAWYRRAVRVHDCLHRSLSTVDMEGDRRLFENLLKTLKPLKQDPKIIDIVRRFEDAVKMFSEIRKCFRLPPLNNKPLRRSTDIEAADTDPANAHNAVAKFMKRLERRAGRNNDPDQCRNARKVAKYYKKYKDYLGSRAVRIQAGNSCIVVPRTNNGCEVGFRQTKHVWRRTLGTKKIARKLQAANPAEMLVPNLDNSIYLQCVCGGNTSNLPKLFAEYIADAAQITSQRKGRPDAHMRTSRRSLRIPRVLHKATRAVSRYAAALF